MNDWLLQALGVQGSHRYDLSGIGKKGQLQPSITVDAFIAQVKMAFDVPIIRYSRHTKKSIASVAICGGSGADDITSVVGQVDCFIPGDTKYRHMKYAKEHDILLLDVGHHAEVIMEKKIAELLEGLIPTVVASSEDYYQYRGM